MIEKMNRVILSLCALAVTLVSSQVVQPGFTMEDPHQHFQMIDHQRAQMDQHRAQQQFDAHQMQMDMMNHQQHQQEFDHVQMGHDEMDQQLGSPLLGLDPFNPFNPLNKLKMKFHPLNPFNPLRIPGAGFSKVEAGHFGGLHFGNALLGSGNPAEEQGMWLDGKNI